VEIARYLRKNPDLSREKKAAKKYEFHRRMAMPWACLVVTLFAIPAGAKSSRQSILIGLLLAMSFFLGFYMLSQVGLLLGKQKQIAPWLGAWLSNLVFFVIGVVMSIKIR
jgi:lipopolysaccharide export LptBFGC system permease protein LptF